MRKYTSYLLAAVLILTSLTPVSASTANFPSALVLSSETPQYNVVVPVSLPAYITSSGDVITATEAKIRNHSKGPVYVESVKITTKDDWELVPFDSDFSLFEENSHKVGFHLNGDYILDDEETGALALSDGAWPLIQGGGLHAPLSYSLKIPATTEDLASVSPLSVTLVVDWYDENSDEKSLGYLDVGGGFLAEPPMLKIGELVPEPTEIPELPGYEFDGWYKDSSCTEEWDFANDVVTGYTVIFAKWIQLAAGETGAEWYQVSFKEADGTLIQQKQVKHGTLAQMPVTIPPAEMVVDGWYTEPTFETKWNFSINTVNGPISLYVKYKPVEYTVTFDSQGGSSVASKAVASGQVFSKPTDPTKADFIFDGWYKEATCENPWNFSTDTVASSLTLFAKWSPDPFAGKFRVDFNLQIDDKGTFPKPDTQAIIPNGKVAEVATLPIGGSQIVGWYRDKACTVPWIFEIDKVTEDMTLYAKWDFSGAGWSRDTLSATVSRIWNYSGHNKVYVRGYSDSLGRTLRFYKGFNYTDRPFENVKDSITHIVLDNNISCNESAQNVFKGLTALVYLNRLPGTDFYGTTVISSALEGCTSLVEAPSLPAGVTHAGSTFAGCTSLVKGVDLPKSILADQAVDIYKGCVKLQGEITIYCDIDSGKYTLFSGNAGSQGTGIILNWGEDCKESMINSIISANPGAKLVKGVYKDS